MPEDAENILQATASYDHAIQALDLAESYRDNIKQLSPTSICRTRATACQRGDEGAHHHQHHFHSSQLRGGPLWHEFPARRWPHGHVNYLNMPELYSPWGYPTLLAVLVLIVIFQLVYFYRKGWLTNR